MLDITCDVQQIDETGYVWTSIDEGRDPAVIVVGGIVVSGDEGEPVFARRVHLDVLQAAQHGRPLRPTD